jgi:hypothetical protein
MLREQRKAEQQPQQIREDYPLVVHVPDEALEAGAGLEAGEDQLVDRDRRETGQRNGKRLMMEHADADQSEREKDEVDWYAEDGRTVRRSRRERRGKTQQRRRCATPLR